MERKRVSRSEPCPVCGKPDWCGWQARQDNPNLWNLYCNRSSAAKGDIVSGVDGNDYVAVHDLGGTIKFEEKNQREARLKQRVSGEAKKYTPRQYTVVDSISPLPNDQLDTVYRCMLGLLPLYKFHAEYLLKEGWSMELIKKHHVCSFPADKFKYLPFSLKKGMITREKLAELLRGKLSMKSLAGVPGAYIKDNGCWSFAGRSGIVFPIYDADGHIIRLRIRMDYIDLPVSLKEDENGFYYMDKDERVSVTMSGAFTEKNGERIYKRFSTHEGKYRPLTSYAQNDEAYKAGFIENIYHKGCEAKNQLTFIMDENLDASVFWITEGEKKALFASHVLRQPFIGLPGVGDYKRLLVPHLRGRSTLDIMRERGVHTAVVAFDADRYNNVYVMKFQEELVKLLKNEGFKVLVADWNEKDGKGIDDLLLSGHLPFVYEH